MKKIIFLISILLFVTGSLFGQTFYNAEVTVRASSTDNLFKNSSDSSDNFASTKASLNLYPLHFSEINIFTEYTKYNKNNNLSNLNYGGGLTLMPLSDSSLFSIYMNMNYKGYRYKEDTLTTSTTSSTEFSDKNINGVVALGYQLNETTSLRTGFNYSLVGYASDSDFVSDKSLNEIFTGLNLSLFGSNAIDFEAGYSFEKYDYLPEYDSVFNRTYGIDRINAYNRLEESDLNSYYVSLRYSRPLGKKTGFSLSYSYRNFTESKDSALILGSSSGYLSPWVNSYDGNTTLAKFKTYLVPYTIISFGVGYWNSSYLKTLESVSILNPLYDPYYDDPSAEFTTTVHTRNAQGRNDDKYRIFMTVSVPIVTSSGRLFEPSLNIDYTDNESTIANYTYSDFSIILSINIR